MADGANEEYGVHERSYGSFIGLMKWGAVASLIVAFLVILIITR